MKWDRTIGNQKLVSIAFFVRMSKNSSQVVNVPLVLGTSPSRPATLVVAARIATAKA